MTAHDMPQNGLGDVVANRFSLLKIELRGKVALVALNNPPVNALSRVLSDEITAAFDLLGDIDEVRAIVLTGAGKHFCAGADLKNRSQTINGSGDLAAHQRRTRECFHSIVDCPKPVVCAVNGAALGAGLAIAASCDVLIAGESAWLGLPEIDVGLLGGARHAMRLLSHSKLRRMMLSGDRLSGTELYRQGIVESCEPDDRLLGAALELATRIAEKAPLATRLAKQTLNAIEEMSLRDGYRYEQEMTAAIGKTHDAKEALLAFLEKRKPNFKGC